MSITKYTGQYISTPIRNSTKRLVFGIVDKYIDKYGIIRRFDTPLNITIYLRNITYNSYLLLDDAEDGHFILKIKIITHFDFNLLFNDSIELIDFIDKICDFTYNICKYKPYVTKYKNSNNSRYLPSHEADFISHQRQNDVIEFIHYLIRSNYDRI